MRTQTKLLTTLLGSIAIVFSTLSLAVVVDGFFTTLANGEQEVPTIDPGDVARQDRARANAAVRFDNGLTRASVFIKLKNIASPVVGIHFHCHRAGENGPVAFGVLNPGPLTDVGTDRIRVILTNADSVDVVDDPEQGCMTTIGRNIPNIAAFYQAMQDGLIYLNVHTMDFPAGEVRGQMLSTEFPVADRDDS